MSGVVTVVVTAQSRGALTGFQLVQLAARRMAADIQRRINGLGSNINNRLNGVRTVATRVFGAIAGAASRATAAIQEMAPALSALKGPAMIGIALNVLPAMIDLLGIVVLLPAAILGAASAMIVMKLATAGLGDAITEASEDWNKWEKANKGMGRWAHDFVASIVLIKNAWSGLRRTLQNRFLRELGADLMELNAQYLPVFARWFPRIADAMNGAIRKLFQWLEHSDRVAMVEGIMRNVTAAIGGLGRVLQPIASMFLDLAVVGAPRLASLSETLGALAEKAAAWVTKMRDNGSIGAWLDKAITGFGDLKGIVSDIGATIMAMYRGASTEGETFLGNVHAQTTAMKEWAESTKGQEAIKSFQKLGETVLTVTKALGPLIFLIGLVATVASTHGKIVMAVFEAIGKAVMWLMKQVAMGLLGMISMILAAASAALGWIPGIGPKLRQAEKDFANFRDNANAALQGIRDKAITVTIVERKAFGGTLGGAGGYRGFASGGLATGVIKVGERGEELIDLGSRGGRVRNAGDTRQAMAAGGGSAEQGGQWMAGAGAGNSASLAHRAMRDLWMYMLNGPMKLYAGNVRVRVG